MASPSGSPLRQCICLGIEGARCVHWAQPVGVGPYRSGLFCANCNPTSVAGGCGCLCGSCDIHDYNTERGPADQSTLAAAEAAGEAGIQPPVERLLIPDGMTRDPSPKTYKCECPNGCSRMMDTEWAGEFGPYCDSCTGVDRDCQCAQFDDHIFPCCQPPVQDVVASLASPPASLLMDASPEPQCMACDPEAFVAAVPAADTSPKHSPGERRTGLLGGSDPDPLYSNGKRYRGGRPYTGPLSAQDQQRLDDNYLECPDRSECWVCIEPLHPDQLNPCGHRRHANILLDCCMCNDHDGPEAKKPDIDDDDVKRRRPDRQGNLLKLYNNLSSISSKSPGQSAEVSGRGRSTNSGSSGPSSSLGRSPTSARLSPHRTWPIDLTTSPTLVMSADPNLLPSPSLTSFMDPPDHRHSQPAPPLPPCLPPEVPLPPCLPPEGMESPPTHTPRSLRHRLAQPSRSCVLSPASIPLQALHNHPLLKAPVAPRHPRPTVAAMCSPRVLPLPHRHPLLAAAARSLMEGKLQLGGRVAEESVQGVTDYSHSKPVSWGETAMVSVVEHPEVIPQCLRDPTVEARRPPLGGVAHLTSFSEVSRLDAEGREPSSHHPMCTHPLLRVRRDSLPLPPSKASR